MTQAERLVSPSGKYWLLEPRGAGVRSSAYELFTPYGQSTDKVLKVARTELPPFSDVQSKAMNAGIIPHEIGIGGGFSIAEKAHSVVDDSGMYNALLDRMAAVGVTQEHREIPLPGCRSVEWATRS